MGIGARRSGVFEGGREGVPWETLISEPPEVCSFGGALGAPLDENFPPGKSLRVFVPTDPLEKRGAPVLRWSRGALNGWVAPEMWVVEVKPRVPIMAPPLGGSTEYIKSYSGPGELGGDWLGSQF